MKRHDLRPKQLLDQEWELDTKTWEWNLKKPLTLDLDVESQEVLILGIEFQEILDKAFDIGMEFKEVLDKTCRMEFLDKTGWNSLTSLTFYMHGDYGG